MGSIAKLSSHVDIHQLSKIKECASHASAKYEISKAIRLTSVISEVADVWVAPLLKAHPNFVTHKQIQADIQF